MKLKVGNTPMIRIRYSYNGEERYIYAKLESYNVTGSIKDRVADYIIRKAYEEGSLKKGMTVVEATSGNTGIALAALGRFYGNYVRIYMPDWASRERVSLMKMYNAEVILLSREEGGFKQAIKLAKSYAEKNNAFFTNQFENKYNVLAHYEGTGKEIVEKLGTEIGGFVSGVGTGGTLMGVAKRIKEVNLDAKIFALEPEKMPLISQNKIIGSHKIEGIGDDFIPKIVNREMIDEIILINDDDAINMSRKIAVELGLGVGISSGANMLASVIAKEGCEKEIVTVFADDNKKYLSTDLSNPIDLNSTFLSNRVKLLSYEFVP